MSMSIMVRSSMCASWPSIIELVFAKNAIYKKLHRKNANQHVTLISKSNIISSFNCLRMLIWVVSGWILYSVWVRGVNTIVDCRCAQWPRAARWGCQWPGLTHTVTSLHQESSIKSIARSSETEISQLNVRICLPDNFFCRRSCAFIFNRNGAFLGIMEAVPNVPGEARDVVYDNFEWARLRLRMARN